MTTKESEMDLGAQVDRLGETALAWKRRAEEAEGRRCRTCRFWKAHSMAEKSGECNNGASPCADLRTVPDFGCTLHEVQP